MAEKNLKPKEGQIIKSSRKKGVLEIGKKIYIGTVNIFMPPLAHFHTGRYAGKKHHLIIDTILTLLVFVLLGLSLYYRSQMDKNTVPFDLNVNHPLNRNIASDLTSNANLDLTNVPAKSISNLNKQTAVNEEPAKTTPTFAVYGRYTDFGAGPLPPKVGELTIYRLFFEITDPKKIIYDLKVTATLPSGVQFIGNTSALAGKAPKFDSASRTITWQVDQYPEELDKLMASFEVGIVPNKNHLGAALPLLSESSFIYYLNQTEQHLKADHLTTKLRGDKQTLEKGIVVE